MKPYDDFDLSMCCEEFYGPDYDVTAEQLWWELQNEKA